MHGFSRGVSPADTVALRQRVRITSACFEYARCTAFELCPNACCANRFRIAALQCPLRPGVPIRMQRHSRNFQPRTAVFKLRCPVAWADRPQIGKQRASLRAPLQDGCNLLAKIESTPASSSSRPVTSASGANSKWSGCSSRYPQHCRLSSDSFEFP